MSAYFDSKTSSKFSFFHNERVKLRISLPMLVICGKLNSSKKGAEMPIYIANENGDWWEYRPTDKLYVIDTDKLSHDQQEKIIADWGFDDTLESAFQHNKVERVLWQFGDTLTIDPTQATPIEKGDK